MPLVLVVTTTGGIRLVSSDCTMATANPSRTRKQPSEKPLTPAQRQRQRDQIAREKTEQLEHQMYERTKRQTKLALALQKGRADALREVGVTAAEKPSAQPKQKPLAKAPKSGRKPQNRKPPKR